MDFAAIKTSEISSIDFTLKGWSITWGIPLTLS
jgi:hypothetical protein